MPVVFVTDALIFVLLALGVLAAWRVSRHQHLRAPWRMVARRPVAVAAAVVLGCYVLVGLLDTLHFRPRLPDHGGQAVYAPEALSALDVVLGHLRLPLETTYSAPFATHGHVRENLATPDGGVRRGYPRLRHGGAYLDDPGRQHRADVFVKTLLGAGLGLVLWLCVSGPVVAAWKKRRACSWRAALRRLCCDADAAPWRAFHLSLGLALVSAAAVFYLSRYYHVLGTDKIGQDVLYLALKSVRTGLVIGTLTTLVMLPFALLLGLAAGYFRGWVDDLIQYLYTTLSSIPGVLLIAAAVLMLQVYMANHADAFISLQQRAEMRLLFLCLILGITSWTGLCRILRGETIKLREMEYVQAAQAFGVGAFTVIARHLLPNVMHLVMISIVLDFSGLVLAEAVLSYLNIGVHPSMASWGNMINGARLEMAREPLVWWSLFAAFLFMFILVLAANLFADAVRDAFDPTLREV